MKPPPFDYYAPASLDEALALRAEHADDSVVLAGGQSLVPMLSLRLARPSVVIDLGRVPGSRGSPSGTAASPSVRWRGSGRWSGRSSCGGGRRLSRARWRTSGHVTIRNRGTVGGSIAHAHPAGELPGAALALDAQLVARSVRGERTVPAAEFFHGFMTTAIGPDEILVEVRIPGQPERSGVSFVEVARRHGDFALVGAAAAIELGGDGAIADARLVFIGVGGTARARGRGRGSPARAASGPGRLHGGCGAGGDRSRADQRRSCICRLPAPGCARRCAPRPRGGDTGMSVARRAVIGLATKCPERVTRR